MYHVVLLRGWPALVHDSELAQYEDEGWPVLGSGDIAAMGRLLHSETRRAVARLEGTEPSQW